MSRLFTKTLLPLMVLVVTLLGLAPAAFAQDPTWQPSFDKNEHVYIDPKLANDPSYPVRLDGLEDALIERGKKHNLQIFVVAARLEDFPQDHNWGPEKLDNLILKWQNQPGFPHDNYLVILWLRRTDNPNKGWVSANGGNRLQVYGFTGSKLSDPNSGPVIPNLRRYMPNDPKGAFIAIADDVNAGIDAYHAAEQARKEREEFMKKLPGIIFKVLLALGFIGLFAWLIVRFRKEKAAALAQIAEWNGKLDNANDLYTRLYDGYFGFLKEQGNWSGKFKGDTLAKYQAAVTDFAEFTVRHKAANARLDEAKKYVSRTFFPMVGGLRKAKALLTTEPVTITGKELPLEMADLFSGVVAKTTYEPEKLLEAMSTLFERTNKALSSIVKSFSGAEQNKKDIDELLAKVQESKAEIAAAGLSFDPYSGRFTRIEEGQQAFASILASDPLSAYTASEKVEADARALLADLERALSIKKELASVEAEIGKAVSRSREVRDQGIAYAYPLSSGEKEPAGIATQLFTLTEENGNPDNLIAEARSQQAAALQAVLAGELDNSDKQKAAAVDSARRACQLVETVLAAKAFVEKTVPAVRANLSKLQAAVPDADKAVAELNSDFLPANIAGQPQKLERAKKLIAATAAELAKVKNAYDEQRYLGSRANLESVGSDIQGNRDGLVEIHAHLAELRRLRQHARDVVAACQGQFDALAEKREANAFTTAAATDAEHKRLQPILATQKTDVARDVTDWPAAAEAADRLAESLKSVDAAIDQQRLDHQRATDKVSAAGSAVSEAQGSVNDGDTRQPARDKLAEAKATLAEVQKSVQKPKSDWAAIGRRADEAASLARKAGELAAADKRAANEARSSIEKAAAKISSVDRSYGHGVSADLGTARSHLSAARSALNSGNYEDADRKADSAYRAADSAEDGARARVAAIVAEIERRCREEEARRRREREAAEAARRRSSSSSSGGGFGGRSGGGGHSGRSGGGGY